MSYEVEHQMFFFLSCQTLLVVVGRRGGEEPWKPVVTQAAEVPRSEGENYSLATFKYHSPWI